MKKVLVAIVCMSVLVGAKAAHAQDEGWQFEITPYFWFAGAEGDVTMGGRTEEIERDSDELLEGVDARVSAIVSARHGRWFFGSQMDFSGRNSDNLDNHPEGARLELDSVFVSATAGYTFDVPLKKGATLGVGIGAQHMTMDLNVKSRGGAGSASVEASKEVTDLLLVLRPCMPITKRLSFNPTIAVGAGDSELTYDLWPNFQYHFSDTLAGRVGYRQLYYEIEGDNVTFEGGFNGLFLGLGVTL
jgi:hypothetical protein